MNFPTGEDKWSKTHECSYYSNVIYALFVALTILFQSIRLKWLRAYILTHVIFSESTTQDLLMLQL